MSKIFRKEVILDFDYTLFDTKAFKQALAGSLKVFGVAAPLFFKFYPQAIVKHDQQYSYSVSVHLRLLRRLRPQLNLVTGKKLINKIVSDCAKYLYPETKQFLTNLRQADFKLILATRGDKQWQGHKVTCSGIRPFFSQVLISPTLKVLALKEFTKNFDEVFFVSDHAGELAHIKQKLSQLIPIMKLGGHGSVREARQINMPAFKNLLHIQKYIINYYQKSNNQN